MPIIERFRLVNTSVAELRSLFRIGAALTALTLAGCAATGTELSPGPVARPQAVSPGDGAYLHPKAGAIFPLRIGAFERGEVKAFDAAQTNIGVGYTLRMPGPKAAVTVYVHPVTAHGPDGPGVLIREFEGVKAAVRQAQPAAILLDEGTARTRHNGHPVTGRVARFTVPQSIGQNDALRSLVYLFQQGPWFVKYRVTYPERFHADVESHLDELVGEMAWRVRAPAAGKIVVDRTVNQETLPAWLLYAGSRARAIEKYPERRPQAIHYEYSFEEELDARAALVQVWGELQAKDRRRDPYLDTLVEVRTAGFLADYVWHFLRAPCWRTIPAGLRTAEFETWRDRHLQNHRAETHAAIDLR